MLACPSIRGRGVATRWSRYLSSEGVASPAPTVQYFVSAASSDRRTRRVRLGVTVPSPHVGSSVSSSVPSRDQIWGEISATQISKHPRDDRQYACREDWKARA